MLDKLNGVLSLDNIWKDIRAAARFVYDLYCEASNIKGFCILVVLIVFALLWVVFGYDKWVINRKSKGRINDLVIRKKYIRGLFVELNESKEYLRYFLNKEKWKNRLIRDYNALFNDYEGFLLKEAFSSMGLNLKLTYSSDILTIIKTIDQTRKFLCDVHNERIKPPERYAESVTRFIIHSNGYEKTLHEMQIKAEMMNTNYCVMIGTAGNGKTNMLCSFSELLMKTGKRCIYVNGKSITEDVEDYIWSCIGISKWLDNEIFKSFYLWWLCKRNKELYFVIDAINENDKKLGDQLSDYINNLIQYRNVRILISCRSEFYKARYKKILEDDVKDKPVLVDLLDVNYSMEAKHRMFSIYRDAFNYSGRVTDSVKEKLCKQLLTMRIFFELNENGNKDYLDLNIYTLISDYIEKISDEKEKRVRILLNEIARKMIEQNSYSDVTFSLLTAEGQDIEEQIEDTMLTSKTFSVEQGRLDSDEELVVQFVYDEVRDYCLAWVFIKDLKKDGKADDNDLLFIMDKLVTEGAVCAEGVIKYIYRDAHNARDNELCGKIISMFSDVIDTKIYRMYNSLSWTLQVILDSTDGLLQCEMNYIESMLENPSRRFLPQLFTFLVDQEKNSGFYTLDLILDFIMKEADLEKIKGVLFACVDGWNSQSYGRDDFIEIDQYLETNNPAGCIRFREFIIIYIRLLPWDGVKEVLKYLKKKDIMSVWNTIKEEYVFDWEELKDDIQN